MASLSSSQSEFTHVTSEGLKSLFPLNFHTYSFDSLHGIDKRLHCSPVFILHLCVILHHVNSTVSKDIFSTSFFF